LYQYDGVGDQFIGPNRTVAYKAFNLPSRIATGSAQNTIFFYDANHQRAIKLEPNGDNTFYVGGLYERRLRNGQVFEVFYVPGVGRLVAQVLRSPGVPDRTLYFHDDALHSIQTVTDDGGNVLERLWYEPFGLSVDPSNLANHIPPPLNDVNVGFTGQYEDTHLGLINMKGRLYDATSSRFITPDSFVQDPLRSESLNRYSYAWNNPLRWIDPSGFQDQGDSGGGDDSGDGGDSGRPTCCGSGGSGNGGDSGGIGQDSPSISTTYSQSSDWAGTVEQPFQTASDNGISWIVPMAFEAPSSIQQNGPNDATWSATLRTAYLNRGFEELKTVVGQVSSLVGLDPHAADPSLDWLKQVDQKLWGISASYPSSATPEDVEVAENDMKAIFTIPKIAGLFAGNEFAAAPAIEAEAGHILNVTVLDAEGTIVKDFVVRSGEMYGLFGHTETEAILELWSSLKSGQTVIMQGQFPVCAYGLCHTMLGAAARATGADIYYYAPTYFGGYSLRTYFGGVGFVPKNTMDRLLIYLLGAPP
jgi:RHS repeat-associated protein